MQKTWKDPMVVSFCLNNFYNFLSIPTWRSLQPHGSPGISKKVKIIFRNSSSYWTLWAFHLILPFSTLTLNLVPLSLITFCVISFWFSLFKSALLCLMLFFYPVWFLSSNSSWAFLSFCLRIQPCTVITDRSLSVHLTLFGQTYTLIAVINPSLTLRFSLWSFDSQVQIYFLLNFNLSSSEFLRFPISSWFKDQLTVVSIGICVVSLHPKLFTLLRT